MADCDLVRKFDSLRKTMLVGASARQRAVLSGAVLPIPPEALSTDQLICKKRYHYYGSANRTDSVHFYAPQETFQLLGLWMLSMLFHPEPHVSKLTLSHPASDIKTFHCDYMHGGAYWGRDVPGYQAMPSQYAWVPAETLTRYPIFEAELPMDQLPTFRLSNASDMVVTDKDFDARDTLYGFGKDRALVRLAGVLLNVGHAGHAGREVDMEGELGYRSVSPGSVEVQLITPGTERWIDYTNQPVVVD